MAAITDTAVRDTGALTKQDVVVVWDGTKDISRNETWKGLCQIRSFIEKFSQTNIFIVNVPNRFDWYAQSCVNYEVKAFNRKLGKAIKSFQNASTVKVTSERDHFSQMISIWTEKGKDRLQKQLQA